MPALVVKATRLAPTEMHPTDSLREAAVNEVACALPCRLLTSSLLPLHVMDGGKTCTPTLEIIYIFGFSFLKADGVVYVHVNHTKMNGTVVPEPLTGIDTFSFSLT